MDSKLLELQQKIRKTWKLLDLDSTKARISVIEAQMNEPNFWNNQEHATALSQELKDLQSEVERWEQIQQEVSDALEMIPLAQEDAEMKKMVVEKTDELTERFEELEFYILLHGEYDANDAIVAFHAGAGGVDAQDWCEMLLRMISRFAEKEGWKVDVLEYSRGGEAGLKSALLKITGRYAYGYLQSEHGTHRLVRISPFDAEGMRHTSFANIEVVPDLGDIAEVEIDENDLRIDVFRAGGHGGQSVNTTDSAVRIVHEPTGITVTCQNEKSQHQNKAAALAVLKARLHQKHVQEQEAERAKLRGEHKSAEWGNQIRSYVLHPYKMVKDLRSEHESKQPDDVLDGDLKPFMESYLRWKKAE